MYATIKSLWLPLLLAPILLTGVKIPRNKGGHYLFRKSQLDSNVWYGRPNGIMDPLPSRGWFELVKLNQEKEYQLGLSYSILLESNSNLI